MNADQFLTLAETLRSYARCHERDTNAANFFVHTMLLRAIHAGARVDDKRGEPKSRAA